MGHARLSPPVFAQYVRLFFSNSLEEWNGPEGFKAWPSSRRSAGGLQFMGIRKNSRNLLVIFAAEADSAAGLAEFQGDVYQELGMVMALCPQDGANASALRRVFRHTGPSVLGRRCSSFGLGDRLGLASPGHIRLFNSGEFVPVLAQQSLRELALTGRSYRDVIDAATWAVFNTGFSGPWGADGDHLKDPGAVVSALQQGCTMITADLSDHLDFPCLDLSDQEAEGQYQALPLDFRHRVERLYLGSKDTGEEFTLKLDRAALVRTVLVYHRAVEQAERLYQAGLTVRESFDFEISLDETEEPTSLEAHYYVASELKFLGIEFTSLAPRYPGEFQKGIDYIGDLDEFEASFSRHARLAEAGGYKISIHSSSDKFSAYPLIARQTRGACHLKTSGTNWLVALETVARHDPMLFRDLFRKAYEVFPRARTYYHITPDEGLATDLDGREDGELWQVFQNPTDRQVLHVSYGELFKDDVLKERFFSCLDKIIEDYWEALEGHIGRHLQLLAG